MGTSFIAGTFVVLHSLLPLQSFSAATNEQASDDKNRCQLPVSRKERTAPRLTEEIYVLIEKSDGRGTASIIDVEKILRGIFSNRTFYGKITSNRRGEESDGYLDVSVSRDDLKDSWINLSIHDTAEIDTSTPGSSRSSFVVRFNLPTKTRVRLDSRTVEFHDDPNRWITRFDWDPASNSLLIEQHRNKAGRLYDHGGRRQTIEMNFRTTGLLHRVSITSDEEGLFFWRKLRKTIEFDERIVTHDQVYMTPDNPSGSVGVL